MATPRHLDPRTAAFVADVLRAIDAHVPVLEAFLLGSAATGGFDPCTSDVDVVVVVERAPDDREALVRSVAAIERPVRDLELVVYVQGSQPPDYELNVNAGEERPGEPPFWFVIDAALAEQHAAPVWDDNAWSDFFEPVPPERLREALEEALEWSKGRPPGDEFARVNAVRSRHYLEHGEWITKKEAER